MQWGAHVRAEIRVRATGRCGDAHLPARGFGRHLEIEIARFSGRAKVVHGLRVHGIEPCAELVTRVLAHAKEQNHTLTEAELRALLVGP